MNRAELHRLGHPVSVRCACGTMANYLPAETVNEIKTALAAGLSLRAVARLSGVSKNTVKKYINDNERRQCVCGAPAGHKGWCKWRYKNSPARQAFHAKRRGIIIEVPKAVRRSRVREARARWDFVFGYAPDWQSRAILLPRDEHYGVIGEVAQAVRRVPWEARDDVRHSIILAVYEGRVLRNQIEEVVSAFYKHEMKNTMGSMWSLWVSLDKPLDNHLSHTNSRGRGQSFLDLLDAESEVNGVWHPEDALRSRKQRAA